MLKTLTLENFTVFASDSLYFGPGLNVIVGENGTGKTHLLKAGYLLSAIHESQVKNRTAILDEKIEAHVTERLLNIYKVDKVESLISRTAQGAAGLSATVNGHIPSVSVSMPHEPAPNPFPNQQDWLFQLIPGKQGAKVKFIEPHYSISSNATYGEAVYLPSKEMLSFFEGFSALYQRREVSFDETFFDLAVKLEIARLKELPEPVKTLLALLKEVVGGELKLDGGRFYTAIKGKQRQEITLLAEGLRKLATLMRLLENGSLQVGGTLFWDEPETNLNPRLIKLIARVICHLSQQGIQVILATHSLFLLKELEILSASEAFANIEKRFFALKPGPDGVEVEQGDALDDLQTLVLLDEELEQSDRFMEASD
ncbi:AAA family ATPase [Stutzerimonas kunmingensis]|uniref:AAA family ATPase n=1 Tax=Stutzerimonas kunmingensis TaxID=1211807 RepID=UPI0028A695E9|nr:ATP-binding protein [Stutzerimonas kunmingensis]